MEKIKFKKDQVKIHNIIYVITSSKEEYEMNRYLFLEGYEGYDYVIVEGYHCSCYDFDETDWEAIVCTKEELLTLAKNKKDSSHWDNVEDKFYKFIYEYLGGENE